ncbi:DUF3325 domain-containing protein [Sphingomonas sp. BK069]|uniref:DUF3325 domain-containing protein n=1 Tax=Sphingomonas sp. BK069 TaxID=2586979 RepID=UPI001619D6AF
MSFVVVLLTAAAFLLLGLATHEHHRRHLPLPLTPASRRRARVVGWLLLGAALPLSVLDQGPIFGPVFWVATCMSGAGLAFVLLNVIHAPDSRPTKH